MVGRLYSACFWLETSGDYDTSPRSKFGVHSRCGPEGTRQGLRGSCYRDSPKLPGGGSATPMPFALARGSHALVCRQNLIPLSAADLPKGKAVYWLTGARLVSYKGNPAALVAYETSTEKISLLVTSDKSVVVAGGEEVRSGNLTFHYRSGANFEVITWTNHGLAYALVSSLTGSTEHSCLVCHQNMADHNLVKH
jgi:hypothetical protein